MGFRYADGSNAKAECPYCHGVYRQREMRLDPNTGRHVCPDDWDRKDLQGRDFMVPFDPETLRWQQPRNPDPPATEAYALPWDPNIRG